MAVKLWLRAGAFVDLTTHLVHIYGDVTIAGGGLQKLDLCSALSAFEQRGILIGHTYSDTGPWYFRSYPRDRTIQSPLTTLMGLRRSYSNLECCKCSSLTMSIWSLVIRFFNIQRC
jgi:hypothetical protein